MSDLQPTHVVVAAQAPALPVVFDSPHSGVFYPEDFRTAVDHALLRQAEDTYVDELYASAPRHGAVLLAARFPRSYIDANRSLDDIDADLIDAPWPAPLTPSAKVRLGKGLIWRRLDGGEAIYDRRLTIPAVQTRIDRCYLPYHRALADAIATLHNDFASVWHINCHSMPSVSGAFSTETPGVKHAEFVLGDRDGSTCDAEFTNLVHGALTGMGYDVKVNEPYKGAEIIRKFGDPAGGIHSLQVEINRALYMDEQTLEKHRGFDTLRADLDRLIGLVCVFARERLPAAAARLAEAPVVPEPGRPTHK